jgi:hypothetical protein
MVVSLAVFGRLYFQRVSLTFSPEKISPEKILLKATGKKKENAHTPSAGVSSQATWVC